MRQTMIIFSAICGFVLADLGAIALNGPSLVIPAVAEAQQMGRDPWKPATRNRSLAAQFQHSERQFNRANGNGGGGSGMGALEQYVENYTYNSTSTSVGNLNEITQILSGGSVGTVKQTTDQFSDGNQGSAANTEVAVDSTTNSSSSAASNAGNNHNTSNTNQ